MHSILDFPFPVNGGIFQMFVLTILAHTLAHVIISFHSYEDEEHPAKHENAPETSLHTTEWQKQMFH